MYASEPCSTLSKVPVIPEKNHPYHEGGRLVLEYFTVNGIDDAICYQDLTKRNKTEKGFKK